MKKFLCIIFLCTITINAYDYDLQAVVLAAGKSSRFCTDYSKLTASLCGIPMINHVVAPLIALNLPIILVVGYQRDRIIDLIDHTNYEHVCFLEQEQQLGTGHALRTALPLLTANYVLVLNGDMPLVTSDIITHLYSEHIRTHADVSLVTALCTDPKSDYGRIVQTNEKIEIIESKHFTHAIQDYPYINAGIYLFSRTFLERYLSTLQENSITREIYITDLIKIGCDNNCIVTTTVAPYEHVCGVNTLKQLAHAESIKCTQLIEHFMANGVQFIQPHTIYIECGVTIGKNSIIYPGVQLYKGTIIGENCIIQSHGILDNVIVADNMIIDPHTVLKS